MSREKAARIAYLPCPVIASFRAYLLIHQTRKVQSMKLIILGIPRPKQSFKFTKTGIRYQPKEVKQEAGNIRSQIINQLPGDFQPFNKGIHIKKCWFIFPPLKSWSKKKLESLVTLGCFYKDTKPDIDNCLKSVWDAMQGVVFLNDSQICAIDNVKKLYGLRPLIEIDIEEI